MKRLALIVGALALVACTPGAEPPIEGGETVRFACYRDGVTTLATEAADISMRAMRGPDGVMRESWSIELPNRTINGRQYLLYEPQPDEVCGPDPPLAMMD